MKLVVGLLASISIVVAGCGGGDGGDSAPTPKPESTSIPTPAPALVSVSGIAIDGNLYRATVFLDLNGDGLLTAGEPTATTNEAGSFTFSATQDQIDKYKVIVLAIAGTTIDQDNPNKTIASGFTLLAPAGNPSVVSPLTTQVVAKMDAGATLAAAKSAVQGELGLTAVDVMKNYVALKATDANYAKAHNVAAAIAEVLKTIEADASSSAKMSDKLATLNSRVTAQVVPNVEAIKSATSISTALQNANIPKTPQTLTITSILKVMKDGASSVLSAVITYTDKTIQNVTVLVDWIVTNISGDATGTVAKTPTDATIKAANSGFIDIVASYLGKKSEALRVQITCDASSPSSNPFSTCAVISPSQATNSSNISGSNNTYTIGGTVRGLGTRKQVTLQNNAGNGITVTANGPFTFTNTLTSGSAYAVTVSTQPVGLACTVSSGSGSATANITNIIVACVDSSAVEVIATGFLWPQGIVVDPSGNIFVADGNYPNNTNDGIYKFTPPSTVGQPYTKSLYYKVANPTHMVLDSNQNMYVSAYNAGQILKVPPGGASSTVYARGLYDPEQLAFDGNNNLYVAQNWSGNVVKISPPTGNGEGTVNSNFAKAFYYANGLAVDPSGNIYVHSSDQNTAGITKISPSGVKSSYSDVPGGGDLAFDDVGNLYTSYNGVGIRIIDPSGNVTTLDTGVDFTDIHGFAFDKSKKNLYLTTGGPSASLYKIDLTKLTSTKNTGLLYVWYAYRGGVPEAYEAWVNDSLLNEHNQSNNPFWTNEIKAIDLKGSTQITTTTTPTGSKISIPSGLYLKGMKIDITVTGFVQNWATVNFNYSCSIDACTVDQAWSSWPGVTVKVTLTPTPQTLTITSALKVIKDGASSVLSAVITYTDKTIQNVTVLVDWIVTNISGDATGTVAKTPTDATIKAANSGFIDIVASYLGKKSEALRVQITCDAGSPSSNPFSTCAVKTTSPPTNTYTVGGTVMGLGNGNQVTIQNNASNPTIISANGAFTFSTPVVFNETYAITVGASPTGKECKVSNGSGKITANVNNVTVTCDDATAVITVTEQNIINYSPASISQIAIGTYAISGLVEQKVYGAGGTNYLEIRTLNKNGGSILKYKKTSIAGSAYAGPHIYYTSSSDNSSNTYFGDIGILYKINYDGSTGKIEWQLNKPYYDFGLTTPAADGGIVTVGNNANGMYNLNGNAILNPNKVTKYSASGATLWSTDLKMRFASGIKQDSLGNTFITGNDSTSFIAKLSPTGGLIWYTDIAVYASDIQMMYVSAFDIDQEGCIYAVVIGKPYDANGTSLPSGQYLMTLNPTGTIKTVKNINFNGGRVKFDRSGDLLMLNGVSIRRYNKSGNLLKTYNIFDSNNYGLSDFVVDSEDNITIVGAVNSSSSNVTSGFIVQLPE